MATNLFTSATKIISTDKTLLQSVISEVFDLEEVLVKELQSFLRKTDFSTFYKHFDTIKVSSVHPFAVFLLQSVLGQTVNLNLLPAITVADTSDQENAVSLAYDEETIKIDASAFAAMKSFTSGEKGNQLLISEDAIAKLDAVIASVGYFYGTKYTFRSIHTVDFNIWSDNKKITSALYDIISLFLVGAIKDLHLVGVSRAGNVNGRKSGDINVEFGKLLFGANISVPFTYDLSVMVVDTSIESISDIEAEGVFSSAAENED